MKRFTYLLVAGFFAFATSFANAQSSQDDTGPKAKNYKPWKQQEKNAMATVGSLPTVKGPKYKNQKPNKSEEVILVKIDTSLAEKAKVTGPKAKNKKYFRKE